jgi:RNA polymerase sigma-70 factor (ECF subfamily)
MIRPSSNVGACLPALRALSVILMGNRQRADDLVEDVIIQAMTSPRAIQPGAQLKVWMFSILHDLYYSGFGLDKRQIAIRPIDDRGADRPTTPSTREGGLSSDDRFRKAFWQLNAHEREVLILAEAAGLSRQEVATVCDCTTRTIDVCVSRARQKLLLLLSPVSKEIRDRAPSCEMKSNSESCPISAQIA